MTISHKVPTVTMPISRYDDIVALASKLDAQVIQLQAKVEALEAELERYKGPLRELNSWAFDETEVEDGN